MEHNLGVYQISLRYILMLFCGLIGGLGYGTWYSYIFIVLVFVFFLEAILAFDPIFYFLGKNTAKQAVDDFQ